MATDFITRRNTPTPGHLHLTKLESWQNRMSKQTNNNEEDWVVNKKSPIKEKSRPESFMDQFYQIFKEKLTPILKREFF